MQKMTILIHKQNISVVEFHFSFRSLYLSVSKMECHWIQAFPSFCPRDWAWEVRDNEVGQRFHRVGRRGALIYLGHTSTYQLFDMSIFSSQPSRNKQVAAIFFSFRSCAQSPIRSTTFRRIQVNLVAPNYLLTYQFTMLDWTELCEASLSFSKSLRSRVQFFLFSRFIKLSECSVLSSEKSRKPLSCRAGDELWVVGKSSFYSFCVPPNLLDLLFKQAFSLFFHTKVLKIKKSEGNN